MGEENNESVETTAALVAGAVVGANGTLDVMDILTKGLSRGQYYDFVEDLFEKLDVGKGADTQGEKDGRISASEIFDPFLKAIEANPKILEGTDLTEDNVRNAISGMKPIDKVDVLALFNKSDILGADGKPGKDGVIKLFSDNSRDEDGKATEASPEIKELFQNFTQLFKDHGVKDLNIISSSKPTELKTKEAAGKASGLEGPGN